jgi:MFS family permease
VSAERSGAAAATSGAAAGRWNALVALAAATLLAMSTWFSGTAVVRTLRAEWGLDSGTAAWLTIAVQLGFVAGSLVAAIGNLLDVFPPRRVMVISGLGAALLNAGFAAAHGSAGAIPLRFATGFFLAGVYPTGLKLMATWFVRDRGTALGIMVGALTLGSAAPHLVNGLGGLPWRTVVLSTSILTLIGTAIAAAFVHEGPFPFPRARFDPSQAGRVLHDRGVRLACLGYFGHMWELYAMWTWFLVFFGESLERVGAARPEVVGPLGAFAVIAAGLPGCWIAGVLADRWGRTTITSWAMAISGVCSLAIGFLFGGPAWLVLAVGLLWGATVVADSAQFSTMVTELADPAYVGTALTLQLGIGFTLTVLTIWLVPLLRDQIGWRWAFALLVPGPLLGIVAMMRLKGLPEAKRIAGGRG